MKKLNATSFRMLAILLSVVFLSSCEHALNKAEIEKKYADKTINVFVKDRYACPKINKLLDEAGYMTHYVKDPLMQTQTADTHPSCAHLEYRGYVDHVLADGRSVLYPVPMTFMNSKFLYRPINEICLLCSVKGGTLLIKKKFNKPLETLPESPKAKSLEMITADPQYIHFTLNGINGYPMTIPVNNRKVKSFVILRTLADDASLEPVSVLYQNADTQNTFGMYVCQHNVTKKPLWGVIIRPIAFYPKDFSSSFDINVLLLLITPING